MAILTKSKTWQWFEIWSSSSSIDLSALLLLSLNQILKSDFKICKLLCSHYFFFFFTFVDWVSVQINVVTEYVSQNLPAVHVFY